MRRPVSASLALMKPPNAIHIGICGALLFGAVQWGAAETVFFDDFNGAQLSGDWTVLRETPSRYSVGGGVLDLQTTPGDVYGSVNTHKNILLIPAPATGDFRVTVRVEAFEPAAQNYTQFDILAFDDQDNLVRCIYGHISGARQLQFGAEVGTSWSGVSSAKDFGSGAFFLRLEKIGNVYTQTYTQTYSLDGVNFSQALGSVAFGDGTPQFIGIWAGVNAAENSHALIDWIKVEDNSDCAFLPVEAVAWWRGENTARDSLGASHGSLVGGATFADGAVGRGFYLDGVDDVVEIPDSAAFTPGSAMTVEAWIRDANPAVAGSILTQYDSSVSQIGWSFSVLAGGQIQFVANGGGATGSPLAFAITTDAVVVADTWTHVAATYDTVTEALKIYVDGVEVDAPLGAESSDLGSIHDSASPVRIGASRILNGSVSSFFSGYIDEPALYWRALSAAEIQAIYAAGEAGKCSASAALPSDIVGAWRGEGDGKDAVGSNHGSLKNGAAFGNGIVGHAFSLDGGDDHVEIPDSATLDGMAEVTLEGWLKFDTFPADMIQVFVAKGTIAGSGTTSYAMWHETSSGSVKAALNTQTGGIITLSSGPLMDTSSFHHLALTYDGANARLYVDGNEEQSVALSGAVLDTSASLYIGRRAGAGGDGAGDALDGLIDEVSLYNRALSASEIAAIHAARGAGKGLAGGTSYVWYGGSDNWTNPIRWTPQAIPGKNDTVVFGSGYLTIDIDAQVGDLDFNNGYLWGVGGSLTVHGVCDWTNGGMLNNGTFFIASGGELRLSGSEPKESGWRVENSGSIIYDGTGDWRIGSGVVIVNDGLLEVRNTRPFDWWNSGGRPLIDNRGTLRKTSSGTTTVEPRLYSSGTVDIQDGVLSVNAPGSFMDGGSFIGAGLTRLINNTFTFSGTTGGSSLEFASGVIEGTGTLSDGMTWTGGYMTGAHSLTIGPEATLTIDGNDGKTISSGFTLNNMGTVLFGGAGGISSTYGGAIVNTGLFEIQNDLTLDYGNAGNRLVFDNQGELRKVTATGTSTFEFQLDNSGIVDIRSGVLRVTGPGNFSDGGSFIGAGGTRLDNASFTYTFTGTTGGSSLTFASGLIAGSGTLSEGMEWTGGSMSGGHSLTIGRDATLTLSGTAVKTLANGFTLNNQGTLVFGGTGNLAGSNATLNNSGLIDLAVDGLWDYPNSGARNQVNNTGTIRKSAGDGSTTVEFALNDQAPGRVEALAGSLRLTGGGVSDGVFHCVSPGALDFAGGIHDVMNGASFTGNGLARIHGGTLRLSGDSSVEGMFELSSQSGSLLNGDGTLTINGHMIWSGGSMSAAGQVTVASGGNLDVSGAAVKTISNGWKLRNEGTLTWTGDGAIAGSSSAALENAGTWNIQTDALIDYTNSGGQPTFANTGTIRKTVATGNTAIEFLFSSSGTQDIQTGSLSCVAHSTFTDGASFTGAGVTLLNGGSATYTLTGNLGGTSLEFASGSLVGSATLTDGMTWTGGYMTGANSLTVGADATLVLAGTGAKSITGAFVLTNDGVIVFQDTGSLAAHSGPTIVNRGLFEIRNDALLDYLNAGANLLFDNQGTLRKTAGEGVSTMEFALDSGGLVDIQTGVFNLPSSATFTAGASFIGNGVTRLTGGSSTYTFTGIIGGGLAGVRRGRARGKCHPERRDDLDRRLYERSAQPDGRSRGDVDPDRSRSQEHDRGLRPDQRWRHCLSGHGFACGAQRTQDRQSGPVRDSE